MWVTFRWSQGTQCIFTTVYITAGPFPSPVLRVAPDPTCSTVLCAKCGGPASPTWYVQLTGSHSTHLTRYEPYWMATSRGWGYHRQASESKKAFAPVAPIIGDRANRPWLRYYIAGPNSIGCTLEYGLYQNVMLRSVYSLTAWV